MESRRGWHVAVIATAVVLGALTVLTTDSPWRIAVALGAIAAFVGLWFAIGRDADRARTRSVAFAIGLVVIAGVGTAAIASFASIQTIAYPLLWTRSRGLRLALIANVALALAVGAGLFLSAGRDVGAAVQAIAIQSISLAFSIALGFWITQIADRSAERQRLLDELRSAQHALASVNRDAGVASERERLAREIHDTIAQDLTGFVLLAQRARRELGGGDTAAADETLVLLEDGARTTLAETRSLVAATAPVSLTTGGIGDALERLGQRMGRETGTPVVVTAVDLPALDRDTEVVLLRCAQEGLANVRKHAGAGTASVLLTVGEGVARLEVRDDGHGFDADIATDGFGLSGMHDRLALVGGTLDVSSSTAGTVLTVTVPIGDAA